jgi:type IV secretion system protein VirD4
MGKFRNLIKWHIGAKQACEDFFGQKQSTLVRLPQAIHTLIIAPSGFGKGVSMVLPKLMTCQESCFVLDYKGENAKISARHREKALGHRCIFLDPYRSFTQTPDCLNVLDAIKQESPLALDECNDLASAIVVRDENEKERHWNDSAEAVISSVEAVVVGYGEEGTRSLHTVREIISNPARLELATKLMMESDMWGGMLRPLGGQLMQFDSKERSSVLSASLRPLRFLGTPAVAESTLKSSFDPNDLRKTRMTIYLIIPPDHARAQTGLLRMWVATLMRACVRGGLEQ